jgi:hypothetical protein
MEKHGKTKLSAIGSAAAVVIPAAVIQALAAYASGIVSNESLPKTTQTLMAGIVIALISLALAILIVGFLFYRLFDETHFGWAAALRWAVVGILYGSANAWLARLFPEPRATFTVFLVRNAIPMLVLIGIYLLVFRLPRSVGRKQK